MPKLFHEHLFVMFNLSNGVFAMMENGRLVKSTHRINFCLESTEGYLLAVNLDLRPPAPMTLINADPDVTAGVG